MEKYKYVIKELRLDVLVTGCIKKADYSPLNQLVERRTGTPLTQVRFPGAAKDFSPSCQLSVQTLLRCPYTPVCNRMH